LRIVVTGGGSGGHITPLLAVADELKILRPNCEIIYIGQIGDSLGDVPARHPSIDAVYTVRAGKLRRYHGEGLRQILDLQTTARNLRDVGYVTAGIGQSVRLLRRLRPDVVFVKGGFVGVPVGLAAAKLGIPYITHDSDAIPGLANRIIARWAARHAVALPAEVYAYPPAKTVTVGVPIARQFHDLGISELTTARQAVGLLADQRALLVTGGGLGARRLNDAVVAIAPELLKRYPELVLFHLSGRGLEGEATHQYDNSVDASLRDRVRVIGFTDHLADYSAVADVVVMRASATTIAEFAAQSKACIVVPNPLLTGGHQTKNAQLLAARQAVRVVEEPLLQQDPRALLPVVREMLEDARLRKQLGERLHAMAHPESARELAMLLLEQAEIRH
jgi:UDP-N-acetylglucosamine--N-acetylmuramyl-(pentapeptide) pyrophosphoryl-undecaprenol N-acetylglucosamine transferase